MSAANSDPILILVAEDDADDLFFLRRVLSTTAPTAEVAAYRDGESAMSYLKGFLGSESTPVPSIAFLDVRMPGLTGLELLRWLRSHRRFDRMATVILTSSVAVEDIATAEDSGAQCYTSKHLREQDARALLAAAHHFSSGSPQTFDLPGNLLR